MLFKNIQIFKTPNNKKFSYKPLYYQPTEDEEIQQQERIKSGIQQEEYVPGSALRRKMEDRWGRSSFHQHYENSRKKVFSFIVVIILAIAIWWML